MRLCETCRPVVAALLAPVRQVIAAELHALEIAATAAEVDAAVAEFIHFQRVPHGEAPLLLQRARVRAAAARR